MAEAVPRALLVDVHGTLMNFREPAAEVYARVARERGYSVDVAGIGARLAAKFAQSPPPPSVEGVALERVPDVERSYWLEVVTHSLGEPAGSACAEEIFERFGDGAIWQVEDGVHGALARARAARVRIAIVSNLDHRLERLLADLDLRGHVDALFTPSTCGLAKPDPRIFRAALQAVKAEPRSALYVGDQETGCVGAARAAGLPVRRYDPHGDPADRAVLTHWNRLSWD
jgi:putative hydrolase of the HAD superfamily